MPKAGDGNVLVTTDRQRFGTDPQTGTYAAGPLGTPTSGTASDARPAARVSYTANYFDAAGRLTDSADVGTAGGGGFTSQGSSGASLRALGSTGPLVTSYAYDGQRNGDGPALSQGSRCSARVR